MFLDPAAHPRLPSPRLVAAIALVAVGTAAQAQAQDTVAYRGGAVEGAGTTPVGTILLEGGSSVDWAPGERVVRAGELTLRVPLARRLDAHVALSSFQWTHAPGATRAGHDDMAVGATMQLREARVDEPRLAPAVALMVRTTLPTGAAHLRAPGALPEAKLALEWARWSALSLAANAGLAADRVEGRHLVDRWGGVAAHARLHRRVHGYVEGWALQPGGHASPAETHLHAGVTALLTAELHLDLHAARRLDGGAHAIGIGFARHWTTVR
ncbi:MAG TPA: hypothetical protein VEA99_07235 [Gemmatimonadaceae bacterium]|nr:hypothetical protein [Gemmatimonadaceae bacterium]